MKQTTRRQVLNFILNYFNVTEKEFKKKTNRPEYVFRRQIYFYLAKKYTIENYYEISTEIGFDHATFYHSVKRIENLVETKDVKYYHEIKKIEGLFENKGKPDEAKIFSVNDVRRAIQGYFPEDETEALIIKLREL